MSHCEESRSTPPTGQHVERAATFVKNRAAPPTDLLRHHVDGHVISDVMPDVTTGRRAGWLAGTSETVW